MESIRPLLAPNRAKGVDAALARRVPKTVRRHLKSWRRLLMAKPGS